MGLDMYLEASRFLWRDTDKNLQDEIKAVLPEIKEHRPTYVIVEGGYWRKANHIHKWFVDNIQDGDDNCKRYCVDRGKLLELQAICKNVVANPEDAKNMLPTQDGFFFGGISYDECYFEDVKNTIEIITKCLELPETWDFYYQSSW